MVIVVIMDFINNIKVELDYNSIMVDKVIMVNLELVIINNFVIHMHNFPINFLLAIEQ